MKAGTIRAALTACAASAICGLNPSRGELVLHVDFEVASDLARDVSGNGANGVIKQIAPDGVGPGGVLSQTSGAAVGSGAALFNPIDSGENGLAIEFPDAVLPDLGADDNFAIAFWVRPTTAYLEVYNPNHAVFSSVATGEDATLSFQIENRGDTTAEQITVARLSAPFERAIVDWDPETRVGTNLTTDWQHVALVSNGQNGRVQIYYDGELTEYRDVNTADELGGISTGLAINEVFLGVNRGQNKLFQGLLDDVRVYDTAAVSEVLSLTDSTVPRLVVDRETGAASISVPSNGSSVEIVSYTIESANGVLDESAWSPIAGGNGSPQALSETFAATQIAPGGTRSLGSIWQLGPFEDLHATALLSDGVTTLPLPVAFEGNGGDAFLLGDIDNTGNGLDLADWVQFKNGQGVDLSALSPIEAYRLGDLDGDLDNDGVDFFLFRDAYDAANFPGAFAQLLSAPEPSSAALIALLGAGLAIRRCRRGAIALGVVCVATLVMTQPASAQLLVYDGFDTPTLPAATDLDGTLGGQTSFGWDTNTWTDTTAASLQDFVTLSDGLAQFPGLKSVDGYATRPARNRRTAMNREIGETEQAMLTAEGADFWFSVVVANRDTPDQDDEAVFLFTETPVVDWRDVDFALTPAAPFRSIGVMFDDGGSSGATGTNVGDRDGDAIYAVYTDGSGQNAVYSDGEFAIGVANEPHLIVGHVTWGVGGGDHQFDIYALGVENVANSLAPLELPAEPFGSLTIPAASIDPAALNTIGFAGAKLPAYDEVRIGLSAADVIPSIERLTLEVDVSDGTVTLKNKTDIDFTIDYLEIKSAAGSLDEAGWVSLSDNPSFPAGDDDGLGWEEATNNGAASLVESFLLGSTTIGPDDEIALGAVYNLGDATDLTFAYHLASSGATVDGGFVEYVGLAGGLAADYNNDGVVDAADYTVWRDNDGTLAGATRLSGDGDGDGDVDAEDYAIWAAAYGQTAPQSTAAVPEPATLSLLLITTLCVARR